MTGTRRSTLGVNKRRKGPMAFVMPWLKRFGIMLGVALVAFLAGSWFWFSGNMDRARAWAHEKTMQTTAAAGFSVKNVLVEGRVYTDPDILKALINVEKGDPLFAFDPETVQAQIKKINWVRDAHVERRLPDTVYVSLQEKIPLALWQKKGELELLDEEGVPLTKERLGRFRDLLIVMGEEAPRHTPELVKNLKAEPQIVNRLKAAKWISNRRWDLVFDNGVTARLPEGEIGLALRKLAHAMEQDALLEKDIVSVDLREERRMIVETAPGASQEHQASAKTGSNI